MRKYGYARCSTEESRQDIERQTKELTALGVGADEIFNEYLSGAKSEKPELAKLLARLADGDTVYTTEVSRLTRSIHQLCHIVDEAKERKIRLVCGSLELDCTADRVDPMPLAMLYIMGVFAELERGMTVERIKSGLANAKSKGKSMGRPRKTASEVPETVKDLLPDYLAGKFGKSEYAKKAGITRPSLYKYLKLLGHM
jgi:DNA invertase Pin-like site-specific DNA recombinase